MERITFRLTKSQNRELEKLVDSGDYPNKSEFIRSAIREQLKEEKNTNKNVASSQK